MQESSLHIIRLVSGITPPPLYRVNPNGIKEHRFGTIIVKPVIAGIQMRRSIVGEKNPDVTEVGEEWWGFHFVPWGIHDIRIDSGLAKLFFYKDLLSLINIRLDPLKPYFVKHQTQLYLAGETNFAAAKFLVEQIGCKIVTSYSSRISLGLRDDDNFDYNVEDYLDKAFLLQKKLELALSSTLFCRQYESYRQKLRQSLSAITFQDAMKKAIVAQKKATSYRFFPNR